MQDILLASEVEARLDNNGADILLCASGVIKMRITQVAAAKLIADLERARSGELPPVKLQENNNPGRKSNGRSRRDKQGKFADSVPDTISEWK